MSLGHKSQWGLGYLASLVFRVSKEQTVVSEIPSQHDLVAE